MTARLRVTIQGLLLVILVCGLVAWFLQPRLYPRRVAGQRFALIGTMDIDRDGRDDRDCLKAMIVGQGGIVDYDLSPDGSASGSIGPMTTWYVLDERKGPRIALDATLPIKKTKAITRARLDGVRPLPIERLVKRLVMR